MFGCDSANVNLFLSLNCGWKSLSYPIRRYRTMKSGFRQLLFKKRLAARSQYVLQRESHLRIASLPTVVRLPVNLKPKYVYTKRTLVEYRDIAGIRPDGL